MATNNFLTSLGTVFKQFFIFLKYLLLTILVLVVILALLILPSFNDLKTLSTDALIAKSSLEQSVDLATKLDLEGADIVAKEAAYRFSAALLSLENVSSRKVFKSFSIFNEQFLQLKYLLRTGKLISQAMTQALNLSSNSSVLINEKLFSSDSEEFRKNLLILAYESEPELVGLKASLELAHLDLEKINRFSLLYPVYGDLKLAKEELETVIDLLDKATLLTKVLPALGGYPQPGNFLFVMHNNDELRPAGGFIGVYGLMETKDGSLNSFLTYDSYHLDMPASISNNWNLLPPAPLAKYLKVERWYLRDSNWSPDWPTSARQIQEIYHGEKKAINEVSKPFTGVISITPDFVAELLDITGPITARGDVYNKDNFQELLQYSVEVSYMEEDISSWDRKDVINEILNEMKDSLFSLNTEQNFQLLDIVSKNINTKNIQLFFNDEYLQSLVVKLNAASEVKKSPGDYLLVVDANLGAFKSDAVVKKSINYQVDLEKEKIKNHLQLNYRHEGGFDWRTTRYRSYTRVYLPLETKLENIDSFGGVKIDKDSILNYEDKDLEKMVIAFFFTLEPGSAGGINIDYRISDNFIKTFKDSNYSLLVQKQSGRRTDNFSFSFLSEGKVKYQEKKSPIDTDFSIKY